MKTLYSLLLLFCLAATASAQDISLTIDGQDVPNKSMLTQTYAVEAFEKIPGMPQLGMKYGLYPEIELTSKIKQDLVVTLRTETHDEGIQFCFGSTCDELYKMNWQSTKTATFEAGKAQDMQIHIEHFEAASAPYEAKLVLDAYGTVDGQSYNCNLMLKYDPSAASITVTPADRQAPYYNLSGMRISQPTRGLYIRGGKKVLK